MIWVDIYNSELHIITILVHVVALIMYVYLMNEIHQDTAISKNPAIQSQGMMICILHVCKTDIKDIGEVINACMFVMGGQLIHPSIM
jgi:uncharacterized membrane protein YwzB